MKCYCGFEWNDEAILKGYEKDEFGIFFRCPIDSNDFDEWNSCMGYVSCDHGNGRINRVFKPLLEKYLQIKKERYIKKTQEEHKYTLDKIL